MSKIEELKKGTAGRIEIDWNLVEEKMGFKLHDNLKDYYSRILDGKISGTVHFNPAEFVKRYVNKDKWLDDANGNSTCARATFRLLNQTDDKYILDFFQETFFGDWTGGNDFGHRAYIGEILINIGQISLVFNNDTGEFEWVDFGYGYFDIYSENPYGIVADHTQEFLDKFVIEEYE